MGIDSLFVVNNRTESLIAVKHWGSITSSEICERVFEAHRKSAREGLSDLVGFKPLQCGHNFDSSGAVLFSSELFQQQSQSNFAAAFG